MFGHSHRIIPWLAVPSVVFGLGLGALVACGDDDETASTTTSVAPTTATTTIDAGSTEPETTEPETTEPETTEPADTFEMIGCEQVAILPAHRGRKGPGTGARRCRNRGRERSGHLAVRRQRLQRDGRRREQSAGPAHVVAQWLPVPGPDEVREGPQFEGAGVLPTAYWEPIYTAQRTTRCCRNSCRQPNSTCASSTR